MKYCVLLMATFTLFPFEYISQVFEEKLKFFELESLLYDN